MIEWLIAGSRRSSQNYGVRRIESPMVANFSGNEGMTCFPISRNGDAILLQASRRGNPFKKWITWLLDWDLLYRLIECLSFSTTNISWIRSGRIGSDRSVVIFPPALSVFTRSLHFCAFASPETLQVPGGSGRHWLETYISEAPGVDCAFL